MNDWLVLNPQPVAHLLVGKMASRPAHLRKSLMHPKMYFLLKTMWKWTKYTKQPFENGQNIPNNHLKMDKIYKTTIWVDVSPIEDWCIFQRSPSYFIRLQECTSWPAGWAHVLMDDLPGMCRKNVLPKLMVSLVKYDLNLRINMMSSAKKMECFNM